MPKALTEVLQELPLERRDRIANRCAELVYEKLNNNGIFYEDLENKYRNRDSSSSQEQKVTFYLFPEVDRCLRILSKIEEDQ
jgi:hypothetical protein